jgi:glycosyltransferase involved in cell wall biosynthesis
MSALVQPLVSVIIPAHNAGAFISETLDSVLRQTYQNKEIIVVDDGSSDATKSICRDYAERHPSIALLQHAGGTRRGVSHSRQLAISAAKGSFVAFCDADDLMVPVRLQHQVDLLTQHPEAVLCHSGLAAFGPDKDFCTQFESAMNFSEDVIVYNLFSKRHRLQRNAIANSTVLARLDILKNVRVGRDQLFQFEDWLLWLLLAQEGPFVFTPEKTIRYRFHTGSASSQMVANEFYGLYARLEMQMHLLGNLRIRHLGLYFEIFCRMIWTLCLILKKTRAAEHKSYSK